METSCGTELSWSELILRHRQFLIKQVEPDFGLVDKLYANGVLSEEDKEDIDSEKTLHKRNSKLLEYIQANGQYDGFTEALKSSNQTHVLNYLEKNGFYPFDDDWPLLDRERSILRVNHETLSDLLLVEDLLIPLYSAGVINQRQRDFIFSKKAPYKRNGALLNILSRRSIKDYKMTIKCLHESKQSHIAQILEEGGVVVRVHAEVPDDRTEDEVVSQCVTVLNNRSTEESRRILERTLNVIAVKKGKSIIIYVYCKTIVELLKLQELKTSGKLVTVLQKLFMDVLLFPKSTEITVEDPKSVVEWSLAESQLAKMIVTINEEEYEKSKMHFLIEEETMIEVASSKDQLDYFPLKPVKTVDIECDDKETQGKEKEKPVGRHPAPMESDINHLPLELMDIVLQKSFIQSRLEVNEMKHLTDKEVIIQLASAQFSWFQRIIKRRLKKKIWRQLSVIHTRNDKTAAIFRNNRPFLESCIRPKGFIKQLRSTDCLTDIQTLMIRRHKFKIVKSKQHQMTFVSDLLNVIRFCDKSRQLSFGRCLRKNGQRDAARVEINGGVVVKAELKFDDAWHTKVLHEEIVEQLNEETNKFRNIIPLTEDGDIGIIGSHCDRVAVVWIWCQSQEALETVKNEYDSNLLADAFTGDRNDPTLFTDSSPKISIDLDQLNKEVVQNTLMLEIEEKIEFLKEYMDPNINLLTRLRADGSLTRKEIDYIKQHQTNYQMNTELLKYIVTKFRGSQLIDALNETGQRDITLSLGRDHLLIIGLNDGSRVTDDVLMINLQNPSEFYHVEEVPVCTRKEATAAVYHNTVYVVGLGTYADKIWKYESKSGWSKCASLTQGRGRHSAAFVDEILYICGGFVDRDKIVLDSVEAYNVIDDTCKSVGKLVFPVRSSGNCVAYKKSLYIFGGRDTYKKTISDVQVYDTVENTCHLLLNPLPDANSLMRAALWRESVILLGRRNCFIYDFSTDTWQVRKQFKTNVRHFGFALSNDRIYVFGGGAITTDAKGKKMWACRNDVRSVAVEEIIDDKPSQWKEHGRLSRPCLVDAFVKSELALKKKELEHKQNELEENKGELRNKYEELATGNLEISGRDYVCLLIIGLSHGSNITDEVLKINLQNPSEMNYVDEGPIHMRGEATATVYHNTVYVVGHGTYADEIRKYDSQSGWNKCASLTQGRRRHSAAFVDEVLYICGGVHDIEFSVLDSVETYNVLDNTCKAVGKLVLPVQSSGNCVSYKKSLYIFGGSDKDNMAISDVQVYDTVHNTCRLLLNPMPDSHSFMRAALYRESVILLTNNNCFTYEFSTETWRVREEFKTNVIHFGLVLSNDRLYVIGGGKCTTDAERREIWTCRDDVRSVAIEDIINDKPVQWKLHGRMTRPSLVDAFALVNNTDESEHGT